jgi:hypothetical protein
MVNTTTAAKSTPPDRRPHRLMSEPGPADYFVRSGEGTQFRVTQVGWQGATGAIYALDENPRQYERGSYRPLYAVSDADPIASRPLDQRYLLAEAGVHAEALAGWGALRALTDDENELMAALTTVTRLLGSSVVLRWP